MMKTNYTEEEYGTNFRMHILEQYKLYVEMADRISQRRMATNNFFVSLNTILFGVISLLKSENSWINIGCGMVGIVLSISWYYLLKSYRQLNSGKFKVIHELENMLPTSPYDIEWEKIGRGENKKLYWPLSHLETALPTLFLVLYISIIIYSIIALK